MKMRSGFTVLEIIVAICVLTVVGILGFTNINDLQAHNRDNQLKTSVNTIQHQLHSFYQVNKYYPKSLSDKTLPGLYPALLKDMSGLEINQTGSALSYNTKNCKQSKCQTFELVAKLEKEASYTKTNNDTLD